MLRRSLLPLLMSVAGILLLASPVAAHNTLLSSDPAEGSVLTAAPTQLTLVFSSSVPLANMSIEMIDATGVVQNLTGSAHGPSGDKEVVTPLPALPDGVVTVRWRLVGPDGHPITGLVTFSIAASPATTIAPVPTTPPPTTVVGAVPPTVVVTTSLPPTATTLPVTTSQTAQFDEPWTTPDSIRWMLRFSAYLAIVTLVGVIATTAFVWPDAWLHPLIRRFVAWSLVVTIFSGIAQLLVVASDITATAPWSAADGLSGALQTDAGPAFLIRIGLGAALAWVVFGARMRTDESRWMASVTLLLGLLATWAFAGHSRSMRWSLLGVPVDVAHHAAAAAWVGGLAIVGLIAVRESDTRELIDVVNRFGRLASVSVTMIVATGVVQTIRLVGTPSQLFAVNHGKLLFIKLVVLGAMLKVADVNRQRVSRRLRSQQTTTRRVVENLRRAMGTELVVGLLIVALTAVIVVSPPAVAEQLAQPASTASTSTTSPNFASVATTEPTSATAGSCSIVGPPLRLGAQGDGVVCLQQALIELGLLQAVATGTFDSATDTAVRALQASRGLDVDGVVGPVTAAALGIAATP